MAFVCDAHVHLYPQFSLSEAVKVALANMDALFSAEVAVPSNGFSGSLVRACCLAERSDCHCFRSLAKARELLGVAGFLIRETSEEACLELVSPEGQGLFLFAGRQISTGERLELLALGTDEAIPEGEAFGKTYERIIKAGGIPVLNWAPGKWMLGRKSLVRDILGRMQPGDLSICDTTLRPTIWGEPLLMKEAKERGIKLMAGSDPLPVPGEERLIGTYGVLSFEPFDTERPVSALKRLLLDPGPQLRIVGRRLSAVCVAHRLASYYRGKRFDGRHHQ